MISWPLGSQPDTALLFPVPAVHLIDVLDVHQQHGRLAFGTNATDIALRLRSEKLVGHLPVFIFPSFTGVDAMKNPAALLLLSKRKTARFAGRLTAISAPIRHGARSGSYPNPQLRPISTIAGSSRDTGWDWFWEIEDVVACEIPLFSFVRRDSGSRFANGFVLRGPTLASAVEI